MKEIKVRLTFTEPLLGTSPSNADIYRDFVGSKAPDAANMEDEVAALGVDAVAEKSMTVFPRTEDGVRSCTTTKSKVFSRIPVEACERSLALPPARSRPTRKKSTN